MPATYYNGSITITHRLFNTLNWRDGCSNNNLWEKTYTYDGVLAIGSKRSVNDTNPVYFSLRGFDPTTAWILGARKEFLRITSTTLGELEEKKRDEKLDYFPEPGTETEAFKVLWDISLTQNTTTVDSKGTTLIDSWHLEADYTRTPLPRKETLSPKQILKYSTSFFTLSDICVEGYTLDLETNPYSPYGSSGSSIAMMYPDVGAHIDIRGVGTDRVFFAMENSTFGQQVLSVSSQTVSAYTPEKPWEHVTPWERSESLDLSGDMLNSSAIVSVKFEGVKYVEKSLEMKNVTSVEELAWVGGGSAMRSGGVRMVVVVVGVVAGFLVLV
ncbi:hypothetical protein L873DRAFT_1282911 [Choiromyces venosus 120613-1]|uniref:Uncharacterized protein n=1 Tax=Choiromyces venosus 120613-1 TaxID=1336337 RepID=A0A3N4JC98_9PEZI|nr:hypothetical protein L873DRAFT_1282911 [Choiromyces venosus 120613-1]